MDNIFENEEKTAGIRAFSVPTGIESEKQKKNEKKAQKVPDLQPDSKFEKDQVVIKIENGLPKVVKPFSSEYRFEERKDNWKYVMTSVCEKYKIIDYDKDKARPYFKALLAKVNKLLEVKLLWALVIICSVHWLTDSVLSGIVVYQNMKLQAQIEEMKTAQKTAVPLIQKPSAISEPMVEDVQDVKIEQVQKAQQKAQNRIFPTQ